MLLLQIGCIRGGQGEFRGVVGVGAAVLLRLNSKHEANTSRSQILSQFATHKIASMEISMLLGYAGQKTLHLTMIVLAGLA